MNEEETHWAVDMEVDALGFRQTHRAMDQEADVLVLYAYKEKLHQAVDMETACWAGGQCAGLETIRMMYCYLNAEADRKGQR